MISQNSSAPVLRYFPLISSLFVTTLIVSNIVAVKMVNLWGFYVPAAMVLFPLAYIFGDILTEVYGFARARQVIWLGFFCNLLAVLIILLSGVLPAAPFWPAENQKAWEMILGFSPRLLMASFIAYLCGEFLNSFVLAKLKVRTKGRFLWLRTIGSTIVGGGVDSLVFITVAFYGIIPLKGLQESILSQWFLKVAYEIVIIPLTYRIVRFLKQREGVDALDTETNFSPFTLRA